MQVENRTNGKFQEIISNPWIAVQKQIVVPAEQVRVFFQNGQPIEAPALNLYIASCELKLNQLLPVEQNINPGKFNIVNTTAEESSIVQMPAFSANLKYAANIQVAHTPADIKRFWRFSLNSTQQPHVMHMICRGPQDFPSDAKLPTYIEMQHSVGKYIDLHLF